MKVLYFYGKYRLNNMLYKCYFFTINFFLILIIVYL